VHLRVLEGTSLELFSFDANYDSKKKTNMVGINNQGTLAHAPPQACRAYAVDLSVLCLMTYLGATCYMNSVLQALYHTTALRRAVFQVPTQDEDILKGVVLALQVGSVWLLA
jgi:ubiquitin carboxyl-terminal hydrolase 7